MRVLHFYKTYTPDTFGGVQQFIYQLAEGTVSSGATAEVLYLSESSLPSPSWVGSHRAYKSRRDFSIASNDISVSAFADFRKLARKADIVHYHYPWPFMDLVHFSTASHARTVVTYHSDILRQRLLSVLYRPLQIKFLDSVDAIVATSPNYLATSPVLNRYLDKVSVIPIGLNDDVHPSVSPSRREQWRKQIGDRFFLFVGMLRYYKGLHILIEAAARVNAPIVILGSGPIESELHRQARKLGVKNVIFLGEMLQEDKVALLELCLAVVFPSHLRSEAFGISLLEGAMFGKPMISCEIGTGTSFVNQDGVTGVVVPPSNADAFAAAMNLLLGMPELALKMGRQARRRYEEFFTGEQMTSSYMALYATLMNTMT